MTKTAIMPSMEIQWAAHRAEHNQRRAPATAAHGLFVDAERTPAYFYETTSIDDLRAGIAPARTQIAEPAFDPPVEKITGAPKDEEARPIYRFLERYRELDVFILELGDASGMKIVREISPCRRTDIFRELRLWLRDVLGNPIDGRSGSAWLDSRQRLPDGSRLFCELLDDEPATGWHTGELRAFTVAELPENLREPQSWDEIQAEELTRERARWAARESKFTTPSETMGDRRQEREKAQKESEIAEAVAAALAKKEKATA
jgi:hypothetical protein